MSDAGRFTARVEETVRYWKKLATTSKLYKSLADALLAAHADLKSDDALTCEAFTERQDKARQEATEQAARWIKVIAGTQPCVTVSTLKELLSSSAVLSEADVRAELDRAALTVIEPEWDVPTRAPVATAASLSGNLNILGLEYSPQVIFTKNRPWVRASGSRTGSGWPTGGPWARTRSTGHGRNRPNGRTTNGRPPPRPCWPHSARPPRIR